MKRRDKIPFSVSNKRKPKPAVVIGIVSVAVAILCIAGLQIAHALLPGTEFSISKAQTSTSEPIEDTSSDTPIVEKTIFVHVEGAVAAPGLFELSEGSRVYDAIQAAGGFTEDARHDAVNLARVLTDGEQIIVPTTQNDGGSDTTPATAASPGTATGKVNINTADAAALDTLPGIGASTAAKIIADREANGPFKTIEDLKRVSGIGDKKFSQLEGSITVG